MKKKILTAVIISTIALTGCASWNRGVQDIKGDLAGGINRTIIVYTANGDVLAKYKGKIDIEANQGGYIKFDYKGKRYIYYNCFVESIGELE